MYQGSGVDTLIGIVSQGNDFKCEGGYKVGEFCFIYIYLEFLSSIYHSKDCMLVCQASWIGLNKTLIIFMKHLVNKIYEDIKILEFQGRNSSPIGSGQ